MTSGFDITEWVPPAVLRRHRVPDLGPRSPIVELLSAISSEITGREIVYKGVESDASGMIERLEIVGLGTAWGLAKEPSSVATSIHGEIGNARWGDHCVDHIAFNARDVELTTRGFPEISVDRLELTFGFALTTVQRWLDQLGANIELIGARNGLMLFRPRTWPLRIATITGEPHAAERRLSARVKKLRILGATIDVASGAEVHIVTNLGDIAPAATLTGASMGEEHLNINAELSDVRLPLRPEEFMGALRSHKRRITLRQPRSTPDSGG